MIRALREEDFQQLRQIHEQYFASEFTFEELLSGYLCMAVVEDENGHIITAGGVRLIAEGVVVTDKNYEIRERRKALSQLLQALRFITKNAGYSHLHAFIHDDNWMRHLLRSGFVPTSGKSLIIGV